MMLISKETSEEIKTLSDSLYKLLNEIPKGMKLRMNTNKSLDLLTNEITRNWCDDGTKE